MCSALKMLALRNFFEKAVRLADPGPRPNYPWRVFAMHHLTCYAITTFVDSFQRPHLTPEEAGAEARRLGQYEQQTAWISFRNPEHSIALWGARPRGMQALIVWMRAFSTRYGMSATEKYASEARRMAMTTLYKGPTELAPDITHTFFFSGKGAKNGNLWVPPNRYLEVAKMPLPIAESAKHAQSHRAWFDIDALCKFSRNIPHLVMVVFYEIYCCLEMTRRKVSAIDMPPAWISYSLCVKQRKEGQYWKFGAHVVLKHVVITRDDKSLTLDKFLRDIVKRVREAHHHWREALSIPDNQLTLLAGASESPLVLGLDIAHAYRQLIASEPPVDHEKLYPFFPGDQIDLAGSTGLATQGSVKIERGILPSDPAGIEIDVCRRGPYRWVHNERGEVNRDAYHGILIPPQASRKRPKSMDDSPSTASATPPPSQRARHSDNDDPDSRTLMGDELRRWVNAVETAIEDAAMKSVGTRDMVRWDSDGGTSKVRTVIHAKMEYGRLMLRGRLTSQHCVITNIDHSLGSDHSCAVFKIDTTSGILVLECARNKTRTIRHACLLLEP